MDIITITSKIMTGIISKIVTKAIKKQLGQDCEVTIGEIRLKAENGMINLRLDVDASISALNLQAALKKHDIL